MSRLTPEQLTSLAAAAVAAPSADNRRALRLQAHGVNSVGLLPCLIKQVIVRFRLGYHGGEGLTFRLAFYIRILLISSRLRAQSAQ